MPKSWYSVLRTLLFSLDKGAFIKYAERLKIEGDWEEAMKRALEKKRPPEGWPRPPKKKRPKKDAK